MDYFDPDEDERPRGKFSGLVSAHDHVGCMEYGKSKASCSECGQVWRWSAKGGWAADHFPGGCRQERTYRQGKKLPAPNEVGRGTRENERSIRSVIARWEEKGMLAARWRVGD